VKILYSTIYSHNISNLTDISKRYHEILYLTIYSHNISNLIDISKRYHFFNWWCKKNPNHNTKIYMWAHSLIQSLAVSQGAVWTSWSVNTKTNLEKHIIYDILICENVVFLFQLGTILSKIECTQNIPEKTTGTTL
jgi:hypothetical protein